MMVAELARTTLKQQQKITKSMKPFRITDILRSNIRDLKPYTSARSEYDGDASILLDANENTAGGAAGALFQRYPDPLQKELKQKIALLKQTNAEKIFLGNGSDEPIDLLIRAVCIPGQDNIITTAPTYGMYAVSARINDITVRETALTENFQPDAAALLKLTDKHTKIIFLCTPNNPTGNLLDPAAIQTILTSFNGLVVIDEAYADFTNAPSWTKTLDQYPNMVVLQTFSKAWGMAGLRLGMAFADESIVALLNNIKAPYNISAATQVTALKALEKEKDVQQWITFLCNERARLAQALQQLPCIETVFPSDANFVLVRTTDANTLYRYLLAQGIVVRNRTTQPGCSECLRITVGTPPENEKLIQALTGYKK
jgi:histidinol-phosphate aminotransferase